MKIKEYDTNELLMIANNVTGEYSDKQVRQAKEEQKLYFTYKNIHPISTIQYNRALIFVRIWNNSPGTPRYFCRKTIINH